MNRVIRLFGLLAAILLLTGSTTSAWADEGVSLRRADQGENVPLSVENMFPGDSVTKEFTVTVSEREPVILYFHADIREGYEKLAEVLMVKIELPDKDMLLYDGLMRDMPQALEHLLTADENEVRYRITSYLDTSVGNEYQLKRLMADLRWWYAGEPERTTEAGTTGQEVLESSTPEAESSGADIPEPDVPGTGDQSQVGVYLILCAAAAGILFLMILWKHIKEDEHHE